MRAPSKYLAASLAAIAFGVSGCGSGDDAAVAATPAPVDTAVLDFGNYVTVPRTIGKPNFDRARLSEGQRLGNYLPTAFEVDNRFKYQSGIEDIAVFGFIERLYTIGDSEKFKEDTPGFIGGFYSYGQTHSYIGISEVLSNAAMVFDSESSATAAAAALARRQSEDKDARVMVPLPDFPEGHAFWNPAQQELFTVNAHKNIVVFSNIKDYAKIELELTDLNALTAVATKNWAAIKPQVEGFEPTPPDKLTDIEMDRDKLLGHSLMRQGEESQKNPPGIYDRHGALHFSEKPDRDEPLFEEAGLEWFGVNATELYQVKDSKGAELISRAHSALNKSLRSAESPKGMPSAKCVELKVKDSFSARFHCTLAFGRYVIEARSNQLVDVHQRVSAQYALLAAMAK
ncbi:DUF7373 family lipoprotein [Nocardia coubleae]|uniref:Uncharacterized protein n=1 Tax=Nocardia coubleae TaxID=356147 RepID=A0A846WCZ4_9NOCA|nr:hypothetical protein [Nocardia coubleae]NKX90514.1 hypothetical protein [Nocardia coubleae]